MQSLCLTCTVENHFDFALKTIMNIVSDQATNKPLNTPCNTHCSTGPAQQDFEWLGGGGGGGGAQE